MNRKKRILLICGVLLVCVLAFSLYQIFRAQAGYWKEAAAHEALLMYRPAYPQDDGASSFPYVPELNDPPAPVSSQTEPEAAASEPVVNETIRQLRADHSNAVGWITIPGTNVDYPFVQGTDNEYFLRRDLDGKYLYAGVPFLDFRCDQDFSGENTVIYGHNLRNGTMFGALEQYRSREFLENHREILVFLENETIRVSVFACLVIDPSVHEYVYQIRPEPDHLSRILRDARCTVSGDLPEAPRFLTLSTCGYEFTDARIVIVGFIREA